MASDGIPKGLGVGPQTVGDIADDSAATVIELSGVIKWFEDHHVPIDVVALSGAADGLAAPVDRGAATLSAGPALPGRLLSWLTR